MSKLRKKEVAQQPSDPGARFAELIRPFLGGTVTQPEVAKEAVALYEQLSKTNNLQTAPGFAKLMSDLNLKDGVKQYDRVTFSNLYWPKCLVGISSTLGATFTVDTFLCASTPAPHLRERYFDDTDFNQSFDGGGKIRSYSTRIDKVSPEKCFMKIPEEKTVVSKTQEDPNNQGAFPVDVVPCSGTEEYEDTTVVRRAPFYGIELEVVCRKSSPVALTSKILKELEDNVILKHDASIGRNGIGGFEIVSIPATFNAHKQKIWNKFFDKEKGHARFLRSWGVGTCGIHIHISRLAFNPFHLARFVSFVNDPALQSFVEAVAGRDNTHYAAFTPQFKDTRWMSYEPSLAPNSYYFNDQEEPDDIRRRYFANRSVPKSGPSGHGVAVNCGNVHTIELRIFRGNVRKAGFFKCLEFTDALFHYTMLSSRTNMSVESFVDWVKRHNHGYGNLMKWLDAHGYITKDKINPNWRHEECA